MNITVAVVTTQLVSFSSEESAKKWISKKQSKPSAKKGQTVEYDLWTHPNPIPC